MVASKPRKLCATCGRSFALRARWADAWDEIRYCSERCRRTRPSDPDRALERIILELLQERAASGKGAAATICPSEAARRLFAAEAAWRSQMERTRAAARRLVAQGRLEMTQRGRIVDPSTARGPIRLRLRKTRPKAAD